jgi:hypothetical protein
MSFLPNFVYIGTSKAGSTWLFKVLSWHPQCHITASKGLYFFCSHYFRGWDWYRSHFQPAPDHRVVGEISHSYLFSTDACQRIHESLPGAKLMACLREPVERTFSDYLDGIKNGKLSGSFEDALQQAPSLINRSRYATHLAPYLDRFGHERIHIGCFHELATQPCLYAKRLFDFLGIDALELPPHLQGKVLPAGQPRILALALLAKQLSRFAKRVGLAGLRGKVKTSNALRFLLYRPFTDTTRPTMRPETQARLRETMADEVRRLDELLGTDFCRVWGYS